MPVDFSGTNVDTIAITNAITTDNIVIDGAAAFDATHEVLSINYTILIKGSTGYAAADPQIFTFDIDFLEDSTVIESLERVEMALVNPDGAPSYDTYKTISGSFEVDNAVPGDVKLRFTRISYDPAIGTPSVQVEAGSFEADYVMVEIGSETTIDSTPGVPDKVFILSGLDAWLGTIDGTSESIPAGTDLSPFLLEDDPEWDEDDGMTAEAIFPSSAADTICVDTLNFDYDQFDIVYGISVRVKGFIQWATGDADPTQTDLKVQLRDSSGAIGDVNTKGEGEFWDLDNQYNEQDVELYSVVEFDYIFGGPSDKWGNDFPDARALNDDDFGVCIELDATDGGQMYITYIEIIPTIVSITYNDPIGDRVTENGFGGTGDAQVAHVRGHENAVLGTPDNFFDYWIHPSGALRVDRLTVDPKLGPQQSIFSDGPQKGAYNEVGLLRMPQGSIIDGITVYVSGWIYSDDEAEPDEAKLSMYLVRHHSLRGLQKIIGSDTKTKGKGTGLWVSADWGTSDRWPDKAVRFTEVEFGGSADDWGITNDWFVSGSTLLLNSRNFGVYIIPSMTPAIVSTATDDNFFEVGFPDDTITIVLNFVSVEVAFTTPGTTPDGQIAKAVFVGEPREFGWEAGDDGSVYNRTIWGGSSGGGDSEGLLGTAKDGNGQLLPDNYKYYTRPVLGGYANGIVVSGFRTFSESTSDDTAGALSAGKLSFEGRVYSFLFGEVTFLENYTINNATAGGIHYGVFTVQANPVGEVSIKAPSQDQTGTSFPEPDDAPEVDAGYISLGMLVLEIATGVKWTANVDDLTTDVTIHWFPVGGYEPDGDGDPRHPEEPVFPGDPDDPNYPDPPPPGPDKPRPPDIGDALTKTRRPIGMELLVVGNAEWEGVAPTTLDLLVRATEGDRMVGRWLKAGKGLLWTVADGSGQDVQFTFGGPIDAEVTSTNGGGATTGSIENYGEGSDPDGKGGAVAGGAGIGGWGGLSSDYEDSGQGEPFCRCTIIDSGFGFVFALYNPNGVGPTTGTINVDYLEFIVYYEEV